MRPIDKKFCISALIFAISCIAYAALLRFVVATYGPQVTAAFGTWELAALVAIALVKDLYLSSCSILFGILISQWIINQTPVTGPTPAISLTKTPSHKKTTQLSGFSD